MFSTVLEMLTVLVMVSISVAKYHYQKKLGEEKVLLHLALEHHNLSPKEVRSATQGRKLEARVTLTDLFLMA